MGAQTATVVQEEHRHLLQQLRHAAGLGGPTGREAQRLHGLLAAHVEREERVLVPLLDLLRATPPAWEELRGRLGAFRAAHLALRADHARLRDDVQRLEEAAAWDGHMEVVDFCRAVAQHLRQDEEVLLPALRLLALLGARRRGATPPTVG